LPGFRQKIAEAGGALPLAGFLPAKPPNRRKPFYAGAPGIEAYLRKILAGRQDA
jgi:hypothetical protein